MKRNHTKLVQMGIDFKGVNTVKFQAHESFIHRLVKFFICHNLADLRHHFKTEQVVNGFVCDVIDLSSMIVYEVESNINFEKRKKKFEMFYHPYIEDIVMVDVKKLDCNWISANKLSDAIKLHCNLR